MQNQLIQDLVAAPFSPFTPDGRLNLRVVERQAVSLVEQGVHGAFVCGTTGESMSLTTEERMRLAQRWTEVAGSSLNVIVHVGHNCLQDAVAQAKHAARIGAAAVGAMPPMFFKPNRVDDVVEFCAYIAAAAEPLPFYYYHIPSMTGVTISMVDLINRAAEVIPTFRGVKYTHNDLLEYRRCLLLAADRFEVPWGSDELLYPALLLGARGAVGSTYNYAASLYRDMMRAFQSNDRAAGLVAFDRVQMLIRPLLRYGPIRGGKAIMAVLGVDCGPARAPFQPLSETEMQQIRHDLAPLNLKAFDASISSVLGEA